MIQEDLMTVPASTAPVAAPDLPSAIAAVRARGLRLSRARRAVLATLYGAGHPIGAEEIARAGGCDLASAYRNLEALEGAGLVRHTHVGHGAGLYAPAGARSDLVACERCGARTVLAPEIASRIRAAVTAASGYVPRFDHFPLTGLCPRCARR
jgi:Fur family transcriptional regulator, ferric uptake regulator